MEVSQSAPVRVIVADDDPLARRLIRDALRCAHMTVIAEASSGREAVEYAAHYRPDVVLMDYTMPDIDGIEATRRISERDEGVAVVLFTGACGDELALSALRAGAVGYLSKDMPLEALPRALRSTLDGEAAISRRLTMTLIDRLRCASRPGAGMRPVRSRLTAREWEVLDLLCDGWTIEDIAQALVVCTETVRSHVKNVYRKLGVQRREEAVDLARRLRDPGEMIEATQTKSAADDSPGACAPRRAIPGTRATPPTRDREAMTWATALGAIQANPGRADAAR